MFSIGLPHKFVGGVQIDPELHFFNANELDKKIDLMVLRYQPGYQIDSDKFIQKFGYKFNDGNTFEDI